MSSGTDDKTNGQSSESFIYAKLHEYFAKRTAEEHAAHLLPYIEPHHRVLDIGCGLGSITIGLARRVPQGSVLGIDVNSDLLSAARALASSHSIPNITFQLSSVLSHLNSQPDKSYDIIHTHQVLMYLPDQVGILREVHRVLRPGGVFSTRDNLFATMTPRWPKFRRYADALLVAGAAAQGEGEEWGHFARYAHAKCHEAGFPWDGIRTFSPGVEVAGAEDLEVFTKGLRTLGNVGIAKLGLLTQEELEEVKGVIEEWAKLPEARYQMLDSACVAVKSSEGKLDG